MRLPHHLARQTRPKTLLQHRVDTSQRTLRVSTAYCVNHPIGPGVPRMTFAPLTDMDVGPVPSTVHPSTVPHPTTAGRTGRRRRTTGTGLPVRVSRTEEMTGMRRDMNAPL